MKPKPTAWTPAADAATHRTRRSTHQDRDEARSASGLLSTIRAKDPARALEGGAFTKRDWELTIASSFLRISIDDFRLKPVPTLPT